MRLNGEQTESPVSQMFHIEKILSQTILRFTIIPKSAKVRDLNIRSNISHQIF